MYKYKIETTQMGDQEVTAAAIVTSPDGKWTDFMDDNGALVLRMQSGVIFRIERTD